MKRFISILILLTISFFAFAEDLSELISTFMNKGNYILRKDYYTHSDENEENIFIENNFTFHNKDMIEYITIFDDEIVVKLQRTEIFKFEKYNIYLDANNNLIFEQKKGTF